MADIFLNKMGLFYQYRTSNANSKQKHSSFAILKKAYKIFEQK